MRPDEAEPPPLVCPQCGTQVAARLLACPNCRWLVHGEELKQLSASATEATTAGDRAAALEAWERALLLLPPASRQAAVILDKAEALRRELAAEPPAVGRRTGSPGGGSKLGAAGLGALLLLGLSKIKLLLLGLTKAGTLFSMLLSFGVYWTAFGWRFALGLVLSIYVHEMGHVFALRRYGIPASAPMFIPGLGAVIRLRQNPREPGADARTGLAGPLYGLGAALFCLVVHLAGGGPIWAAVASVGAWINLFNLLPVWQLDGGRAFQALTRSQRWLAVLVVLVMWLLTGEGLLVLLVLVGVVQAAGGQAAERPDRGALGLYVALVVALAALAKLPVPRV
jgi:Zn-dependent protease